MAKQILSSIVSCVVCHHVFSPRWFEGHKCTPAKATKQG